MAEEQIGQQEIRCALCGEPGATVPDPEFTHLLMCEDALACLSRAFDRGKLDEH